MQLTKHEFIALEIFKYKDLTIDEAWETASEFLLKSGEAQTKKLSNISSPLGVDLSDIYIDCIPQGGRRLEVGQVWCNWYAGYTKAITQEDIESRQNIRLDINTELLSIAPSENEKDFMYFLTNGWQWELLRQDEDIAECKARVLKERDRLSKLEFWQATPFEAIGKLAEIDITVRTTNILKSIGILTYAEILKRSPNDLISNPHFGKKCLNELTLALSKNNLYLGMLKISD